jgi:hypothetical protein
MSKLEPGWRKAGARWSIAISLKGQYCATAPLAPPPYRGGQVVVVHGPVFLTSKCGGDNDTPFGLSVVGALAHPDGSVTAFWAVERRLY